MPPKLPPKVTVRWMDVTDSNVWISAKDALRHAESQASQEVVNEGFYLLGEIEAHGQTWVVLAPPSVILPDEDEDAENATFAGWVAIPQSCIISMKNVSPKRRKAAGG